MTLTRESNTKPKRSMVKSVVKRIVRRAAWSVKKKTVIQILQSRCRHDGIPQYGRFTPGDIERIILCAESNVKLLMPYFNDLDRIGNYQNEYGGLLDLAIYRALVKEGTARDYAMNLVGDMMWQARLNTKGVIPIIDPLRTKLAKLTAKDSMAFLEKRLKDGMRYPYSQPGYRIHLHRNKDVFCMDIYSCPVYDFYKQFGEEEMELFRKTWCTFDYSVAEHLIEGGKYQREHTLSDGHEVCDMRWFIQQ